jgi:hypothetical protein
MLLLLFMGWYLWKTNPSGVGGEAPVPLRFERYVVDFGEIRGVPEVEHTFAFKVWEKGPISVLRLDSSCGCTELDPDLTKQVLQPGTTHTVRVKMRVSENPGLTSAGVHFVTDPPSPSLQRVMLKAWVLGRPQPSPKELFLKACLGVPASGVLYVNYQRRPNAPKLHLDREKCEFAPFILQKETLRTESLRVRGDEERDAELDHLELTLGSKDPFPVGRHYHIVRLAWGGGHPPLNVAVTTSVEHPLRPALSEVFCGELAPGERWELDVPLVRSGMGEFKMKSVTCDRDFVQISQKDMGASLGIKVHAPQRAGRFTAVATLKCDDPSLPPYSLPISGIVRSVDR